MRQCPIEKLSRGVELRGRAFPTIAAGGNSRRRSGRGAIARVLVTRVPRQREHLGKSIPSAPPGSSTRLVRYLHLHAKVRGMPAIQRLDFQIDSKVLEVASLREEEIVLFKCSLKREEADAVLRTLTADVLKSSEIEGEKLDEEQVRSSSRAGSAWTSAVSTGGPERRGDRGDDARRDPPLRTAPDRRASLRVARRPVPDRAKRNAQDHGRGVA